MSSESAKASTGEESLTVLETYIHFIGKAMDNPVLKEMNFHYLVGSVNRELEKFKVDGFVKISKQDIQATQMKVILQNLDENNQNNANNKPLEDEELQLQIWTLGFKMMHDNVNIYIFHSDIDFTEETILEKIKTCEQSYIDEALLKAAV